MSQEEMIFATKNKGKLKEINEIFGQSGLKVISMEEAYIDADVVEDGKTFEENAIKKAVEIMNISKKITLADDSGLEIDYLDKAPGIYSARYLGEDTPYDIKNQIILDKLQGVPEEKRSARFVCVIAASFPNGKVVTTKGIIEGRIGYESKGNYGFGYDPIFYVPEYEMTTGEMEPDQKNAISHRGKAVQKMKAKLTELLKDVEP